MEATAPLPPRPIRLLYVEDNPRDVAFVRDMLEDNELACEITAVDHREAFVEKLQHGPWDLILSDYNLPEFDGLSALRAAKEYCPHVPAIVITGTVREEEAVACLKLGAVDYVLKDRLLRLPGAVRRAIDGSQKEALARKTEADLRQSERRLNAIVHQSEMLLYTRDQTGRFTYVSPQVAHFLHTTTDSLLGQKWANFAEPLPENERSICKLQANPDSLDSQCVVELRFAGEEPDAPPRWIALRESLFSDEDNQTSVLGVGMDITDRKTMETQMLQTQRLENLGLLAAGIAHDLNNVLAPVMMAGPLLRPQLNGTHHERLIDVLEKSATRGAALVKQVLSFARGDENQRNALQVKHLIRDIVSIVQETFPKNIECHESIGVDIPAIHGNATQFHQVLLNLCVNARDAMPKGGHLSIAVESREITNAQANNIIISGRKQWVVITVTDTGEGIPPHIMEKIWTPFFSTKEKQKGTGLGLATVRGIVAAHAGYIEINSEVGKGTTFEIFLPAMREPVLAGEAKGPVDHYRGKGEHILIVDDEPLVRDMLSVTLGKYDFELAVAADGVEALSYINTQGNRVRLLITDIHMPHMSGDVLISVVRKLHPQLKTIAISGHPDSDQLPLAPPEDQPDIVLAKPFKSDRLLREIGRLLDPATAASEHLDVQKA
ncbi:ATP-binding response regulator [Synoicihabitans lomoniglobus]|uniref:histidine kinase n=1 Tax=Synoicihabitans lomoniglobus TaxID=2909285 RepID=A0AAF0A260_9BACT|nr:response regulator [Opitutaceae bacterium LMO-M01]WED65752.1 response regulator [Opitutaceae bacterium LMO-M01]